MAKRKAITFKYREDIVPEIERMQGMIKRYLDGDKTSLGEVSYFDAIKYLKYLRNRQIQLKNKPQ